MEHSNKRGWIKNVIIIFLVIMLILTLFSNTIMNRSLPEVSVSNSEGGQITSQVKLSGTVSANQTRQITLEEARTVDTVAVRRGDTVQRGDVLATLVAGESADVYDLEIELRRLEIEYKQMLVQESDSLVAQYRVIEDSEKALVKLDAYEQEYAALSAAVQSCEAEIAVLENDIATQENAIKVIEQQQEDLQDLQDSLDEKIEDLQKQQEDYSAGGYTSQRAFEKEIKRLETAIEKLEDAVSQAKSDRSKALAARTKAQEALDAFDAASGNLSDLAEEIADLEDTISAKKQEKNALQREYNDLLASVTPENTMEAELAAKRAQIDTATAEIETLEDRLQGKKDSLEDASGDLDGMPTREELEEALAQARDTYSAKNDAYNAARESESDAEAELEEYSDDGFAYFLLQSRIEEYEAQKEPIEKEYKTQEKAKEEAEEVIADLEEQLADAEERLAEAESEIEKTPEECEKERLTLVRAIEDAESAIELAKTNGAIEDETAKLNLSIKKSEIDRKKKQISDLKAELTDTEIKAPVGGTVASVSVAAGDETEAGTVLFEITMNEMGYTMQCSVTNSQAARLRVGQEAEVQYYYWGAKPSVRITQIAGDPNSGGKNKLVTFAVEGDVSEGTSLSLAIGTQGASYDTIVPNSAIREDANGQFILKVVAKSSPLGNRYYAERLNVEVLASDATKSAIDASLSWGDYVITGASVPISEGMQVRMAEK